MNGGTAKTASEEKTISRVARLREARGWTLERLARRLGMGKKRLGRIEHGTVEPDTALCARWGRIVGADPQWLLNAGNAIPASAFDTAQGLRRAAGLTRERTAEHLGCTCDQLAAWEMRRAPVPSELIGRWAQILSISAQVLRQHIDEEGETIDAERLRAAAQRNPYLRLWLAICGQHATGATSTRRRTGTARHHTMRAAAADSRGMTP